MVGGAIPRPVARALNDKYASALRELEALAGALAAVLLAFLHALVAGEIAAVAQLLVHAASSLGLGAFGARGGAEHAFQGAGDALADGTGLAGETAAVD